MPDAPGTGAEPARGQPDDPAARPVPPLIVVDDREPRKIKEELAQVCSSLGIPFSIARQPFGDYHLIIESGPNSGQVVVFERKTIGDLLHTWKANRLSRQLRGLREVSDIAFLLVEGEEEYREKDGQLKLRIAGRQLQWTFKSIHTFLASLPLSGIFVHRIPGDHTQSLIFITSFHQTLTHAKEKSSVSLPAVHERVERADVAALCAAHDVGTKLALSLIEHFGSTTAVINAADEELKLVPGMGPVRLTSFRAVFPNKEALCSQTNQSPTSSSSRPAPPSSTRTAPRTRHEKSPAVPGTGSGPSASPSSSSTSAASPSTSSTARRRTRPSDKLFSTSSRA